MLGKYLGEGSDAVFAVVIIGCVLILCVLGALVVALIDERRMKRTGIWDNRQDPDPD